MHRCDIRWYRVLVDDMDFQLQDREKGAIEVPCWTQSGPRPRPDTGQYTSEKLTVAAPKIVGVATMVSTAAPALR
jgi:hypothetical protein